MLSFLDFHPSVSLWAQEGQRKIILLAIPGKVA